jgi:hypothetical protein
MSNFYCCGCYTVLNSQIEYGQIDGLPYCVKCYLQIQEASGAPAPADEHRTTERRADILRTQTIE